MENENITDVILSAVKMAVTPLNERISQLEAQLKQENKEPEQFDWDKTVKRLRESGKIKW